MKNRLALLAAAKTPVEPLGEHFRGLTAVAYHESDPVCLAKAVHEFAQENELLTVKGCLFDGVLVDPERMEEVHIKLRPGFGVLAGGVQLGDHLNVMQVVVHVPPLSPRLHHQRTCRGAAPTGGVVYGANVRLQECPVQRGCSRLG